jgi:hypothetical protein
LIARGGEDWRQHAKAQVRVGLADEWSVTFPIVRRTASEAWKRSSQNARLPRGAGEAARGSRRVKS